MSHHPTINPQDANKNNSRLFQLYEKKLLQPDIHEYASITEKLALWLSDAKAYYAEARSFIIRLLYVSQLTLRKSVGYTLDLQQPFPASKYLMHTMTFYYVKLVKSIEPFLNLFVESDLQRGAIALLRSVQNIQLAPLPTATPAAPQRPPVAGLFTNQNPRASYASQTRQQTGPISISTSSSVQEISPPVPQRELSIKRSSTSSAGQQGKLAIVRSESISVTSQSNIKTTSVAESEEKSTGSKKAPEVEKGSADRSSPSIQTKPKEPMESIPTPPVTSVDKQGLQPQPQLQTLTPESPNQSMLPTEATAVTKNEMLLGQAASIEPRSLILPESVAPNEKQLDFPKVPFNASNQSLSEDVVMQDYTHSGEESAMQIDQSKITNICGPLPQKPPEQKRVIHSPQRDLIGDHVDAVARPLSHLQESSRPSSSAIPTVQPTVVPPTPPPTATQAVPTMDAHQGLSRTLFIPEESTLGQLFAWYEGRKMRNSHISKEQELRPSKDVNTQRKSVQDRLTVDNALLDHMAKVGPADSKFYQEVHVVGITKGVATSSSIKFSFSLLESETQQLKIWVNKVGHLIALRSAICMSLGCYSSNDLFQFLQGNQSQDLSEAIKKGVARLPCVWPQNGRISMNVNINGVRKDLPLSPPLVTTKEGLVDVSEFLVAGRNVIRIHQSDNCEQYTFVLHAHRPTISQLQDVLVAREQDAQWQNWLSDVARPIEMEQKF